MFSHHRVSFTCNTVGNKAVSVTEEEHFRTFLISDQTVDEKGGGHYQNSIRTKLRQKLNKTGFVMKSCIGLSIGFPILS